MGLYTRLEAAVVTIVFEARIVGGTAAPTPEAIYILAHAPESIPWATMAFKTTTWASATDRPASPDVAWPASGGGR